jgi:hypothetical protein
MSALIFLSYAERDSLLAAEFHEWLKLVFQTPCFMASVSSQRDASWRASIRKAVANCKVAVVLVTPNSQKSDWVNFEIGMCEGLNIRVFPVRFQEPEKTRILRVVEEIPHFTWSEQGAVTLAKEMFKVLKDQIPDYEPVVPKFGLGSHDFGPKSEDEFIDLLFESRPLAYQPGEEYKFSDAKKYDLSPIIIDPFIDELCAALDAARNRLPIELSTRHRAKVAKRMIERAENHIRAICVTRNDPWLIGRNPEKQPYLQANCAAGLRLQHTGRVKRLFLFPDEAAIDAPDDRILTTMRIMQNSEIDLFCMTEEEANGILEKHERPELQNLLIVDAKWMTASTGEGHDGKYFVTKKTTSKKDRISESLSDFELLLPEAVEIPNPLKSSLRHSS